MIRNTPIKRKDSLIYLTQRKAIALRKKLYKKQARRCAVLDKRIKFDKAVLDHHHITQKEQKEKMLGKQGKGLVRGVLDYRVNAFEGDVLKKYKKRGLSQEIALPCLLRNLANYLENPPCPQKYIHPSSRPKPKRFGKRDYSKICKYYFKLFPRRTKIPPFPKSGIKKIKSGKKKGTEKWAAKLTPKWEKLLNQINQITK